MGWASATPLFDSAVETTLQFLDAVHPGLRGTQPPAMIQAVVEAHYTNTDWDDWDTQDESEYFDPYLQKVMIDLGEIDPDEY